MAVVGRHRAAADKAQPVTGALDHAPAGAPEPWIDADNANRSRHAKITIPRHHCMVATEGGRDQVVSNQVVSCHFKVLAPGASATDDRRETGGRRSHDTENGMPGNSGRGCRLWPWWLLLPSCQPSPQPT